MSTLQIYQICKSNSKRYYKKVCLRVSCAIYYPA